MKIRVEAGSIQKKSVTGVGHYTNTLIESLSLNKAISIEAVTLPTGMSAKDNLVVTIPGLPRRIYVKLNQFLLAPRFDIKLNQVDLTIFPDFALWPTSRSKLCAVVIHDLTYLKFPEYMRVRTFGPFRIPVTTWYLSTVVKRAVRKADFIITVSNTTKDDLVSVFGISSNKVIVTEIRPSSDFTAWKSSDLNKAALLEKYSIPTKDYIISVGTIEPRKNQLATLRAYINLPKDIKESYSLVFAGGEGWSSEGFMREFSTAKASGENVILTGYFDQRDSYSLYKHSSVFTSASYYEGFGMPVLEAMSAQTPTILSDIPIYREVADDSSLFIDPLNTGAYSQAIFQMLTDSALRDKTIASGKSNLSRYSWENNIDRIISKSKELL